MYLAIFIDTSKRCSQATEQNANDNDNVLLKLNTHTMTHRNKRHFQYLKTPVKDISTHPVTKDASKRYIHTPRN